MSQPSGSKSYDSTRLADYTTDSSIRRGSIDLPFMLISLLLLGIGVIMVLSASFARAYYTSGNSATYYFTRQLGFAGIGVVVMLLLSRIPMIFYRRISTPVLLISIILLAVVPFIGVGDTVGSKRWIDLGFTTFQPSELVKIAIILFFAHRICLTRDKMSTFKHGILPFAFVLVVVVGLLALEPHLSGSIIVIAIAAVMLFLGGVKLYWFIAGIGVVGAAGVLAVNFFSHASSRISVWLDPLADTTGDGWQILQSLYAIGSGGFLGLGLGQSRQKYLYLPEEHNDFIFSVVCEELGFIGAVLILALFVLLIVRGYYLAIHSKDRFSFLVCAGITTLLAIQVILNIAVVTSLVPCTGISLPFFSYGGTALLIQMAEIGIILSMSRDIPAKKST